MVETYQDQIHLRRADLAYNSRNDHHTVLSSTKDDVSRTDVINALESSMSSKEKYDLQPVEVRLARPSTPSDFNSGSLVNRIRRLRVRLREPLAEALGTFLLVYLGVASNIQAFKTNGVGGDFLSSCFGWGGGTFLGVLIAGGVSGGHINPAITLSLAIFRGFPWKKVPIYVAAQLFGAFIAGLLVQANYFELLNEVEGGYGLRTFGLATSSANVIFTNAQPWMSNIGAFFDEVFCGCFLMIGALAVTDNKLPAGLGAIGMLWVVCVIGVANGIQTGFSLNPARDLGPRIAGSIFGYPSTIWSHRNGFAIWCNTLGTTSGALVGNLFYDIFICWKTDVIRPDTEIL